jgi:DNA modification methylase/superfamily II DNA or RNA helicase
MNMYQEFLNSKKITTDACGKEPSVIHPVLFDFQAAIVRWAVRRGRAAIFADVGLGKTVMYCEWMRQLDEPTLIITPLAVAQQTVNMARDLMNVDIRYIRSQASVDFETCKFYVTNYEMLEHFDPACFNAIVIDESSILKSLDGKTKRLLMTMFAKTPYRLACTATPSPNDITEIGNHAEFLSVMSHYEMCSAFFVYDSSVQGGRQQYRLKGHAKDAFYQWLASWAVAIKKPSDLGFNDDGYILPPLNLIPVVVASDYTPAGMLPGFNVNAISAVDAKKVRRVTINSRAELTISQINSSLAQWIVWTGLNDEAAHLDKHIAGSFNLHGSLSIDEKVQAIDDFLTGKTRVLITKSSIAGMGVNMQHCSNMLFFGIDYSWEQFYQSIGRIRRFGQKADQVNAYVVFSEAERSIFQTVHEKGLEAETMMHELILATQRYSEAEIRGIHREFQYSTENTESRSGKWKLMLGDSCERMKEIPDNSVDLSVYSPPFPEIFVYSPTERDLGNSKTMDEFFHHYRDFIITENLRITKPGRLACVHVADGRILKSDAGFRGRRDFSGMVIEAYQDAGWIFWQRITVDKNPQAQAIRMKDHGLLFKTLKTDATELSGGHPDYLLIFRKKGDNAVPVTPFQHGEVSADDWIKWAHPVWLDIKETNTLNVDVARTNDDEKHMCPLQLDLIERCIKLYSNPGELVFTPFAGIGSELYEAIHWKRRALGIELKPEYYRVALRNLENAETKFSGRTLFDLLPAVNESAGD